MNNDDKKLRGAQASPENKRRYAEEIAKMEALGERFPTNQFGKVSVGAFATRCGFSRSVLEGGALDEQFADDVKRLGLSIATDMPRLRKKVEKKQKMASDLHKQLNLKNAEVATLREMVEQLTKQVRELQLGREERNRTLEHMLTTGERFFL